MPILTEPESRVERPGPRRPSARRCRAWRSGQQSPACPRRRPSPRCRARTERARDGHVDRLAQVQPRDGVSDRRPPSDPTAERRTSSRGRPSCACTRATHSLRSSLWTGAAAGTRPPGCRPPRERSRSASRRASAVAERVLPPVDALAGVSGHVRRAARDPHRVPDLPSRSADSHALGQRRSSSARRSSRITKRSSRCAVEDASRARPASRSALRRPPGVAGSGRSRRRSPVSADPRSRRRSATATCRRHAA